MTMGLVHPRVGLGCHKLILFFTTIIIPLRKSLTVIYHHSLHHEFFPQLPFYLLTYRLLIYVVDLNYVMLLFDVGLGWVTSGSRGVTSGSRVGSRGHICRGLGWVCKVMGWVGLGYRKWTHGHVCDRR